MDNLLAQANVQNLGSGIKGVGPFVPPADSNGGLELEVLFSTVLGFLTTIAGLAFILYFILGGIKWLTSSGDKGKVDEAKQQMTSAAIGLIIVIASYAIAAIVGQVLGINILSPSSYINNPANLNVPNVNIPNVNPF